VISQAISLGLCPPVEIVSTSRKIRGQIYVGSVNFILMILTIAVVLGFQTSSDISNAYGVTICSMMVMTTILFMVVMRYVWEYPLWKVLPFGLFFLIVDFSFLASVYFKIPNGGYVAIINAAVFAIPMLVWYIGEQQLKYWKRAHDTSSPMEKLPDRFVEIAIATSEQSSKGKDIEAKSPVMVRVADTLKLTSTPPKSEKPKSEKPKSSKEESEVVSKVSAEKPSNKSSEKPEKTKESKNANPDAGKRVINEPSTTTSSSGDIIPPDSEKMENISSIKQRKDELKDIANPLVAANPSLCINMLPSVNKPITFLPHVGVFLCNSKSRTPSIFESFIARVSGIPATVVFLKPTKANIPIVASNKRIALKKVSENIYFLQLSFGYTENVKANAIEEALKSASVLGLPMIDMNDVTVFASAEVIRVVSPSVFNGWKVHLYMYLLMKRLFFGIHVIELPPEETIYLTSVAAL